MPKYISILGDSVSTFHGYEPEGYLVYYNREYAENNGMNSVEDTWWQKVIRYLNGELLVNASYSGSRVTGKAFPAGVSAERIEALHGEADPDVILVYLGYNDEGYDVPVDKKPGLSTEEYFGGAYPLMLRRLKERYPEADIYCGTLMNTGFECEPGVYRKAIGSDDTEPYNSVIRRSCSEAGVYLADLEKTGLICDTLDGSHSTRKGHSTLAEAWIRSLSIFSERRGPA